MRDVYQDRWKRFIKRWIRNIDYLSFGISDKIIEEMSYMFDLVSIKEDNYLFRAGTPCRDIYIISKGELNIFVYNNTKETFVETLYAGCTIGSYCSLTSEEYTISGKARNDLTVLKLPFTKMQALREKYDDLDNIMGKYETYLDDNGLPYLDYKLYRTKHLNMKPKEKLKYGVKRIVRIVKSYKSTAFHDFMEKIRDRIKHEKKVRENLRRSTIMRSAPLTFEERTQKILIDLVGKVEGLKELVRRQDVVIQNIRTELWDKIEKLKWYEGGNIPSPKNQKDNNHRHSKKNRNSKANKNKKFKPKVDNFTK